MPESSPSVSQKIRGINRIAASASLRRGIKNPTDPTTPFTAVAPQSWLSSPIRRGSSSRSFALIMSITPYVSPNHLIIDCIIRCTFVLLPARFNNTSKGLIGGWLPSFVQTSSWCESSQSSVSLQFQPYHILALTTNHILRSIPTVSSYHILACPLILPIYPNMIPISSVN